jgi:hypothetical protein
MTSTRVHAISLSRPANAVAPSSRNAAVRRGSSGQLGPGAVARASVGRIGHVAGQRDGAGADRDVDQGRGPEARPDAGVLDEHQARQRGPRDGTERVQAVQLAELWLQRAPLPAGERPGQDGKRGPHQGRRHEQHQRGQAEPQRQAQAGPELQQTARSEPDLVRQREHQRGDHAEHADGAGRSVPWRRTRRRGD